MQDFGTKADNSPPPGGQLSAVEFNNLATENETAVLRSGQSLSGASATQLAQSLFLHGVKSESFQDSGAANAYVATPVSGAAGVFLPATYANMEGAVISLKASNANSGGSTLNIGQTTGTLIGAKAIVDQGGNALTSGAIQAGAYIQLKYDPSIGAGSWVLLPWSGGGKLIKAVLVTASTTYTFDPRSKTFTLEGVGPGGAGGGSAATSAGQTAAGSGGTSGGYAKGYFTIIAPTASVVIGTPGAPAAGNINGGSGGASNFGTYMTLPGGPGGTGSAAATTAARISAANSGTGSAPTGGNLASIPGEAGDNGIILNSSQGGQGGSNPLGAGGNSPVATGGRDGVGFGSGGSGANSPNNTAASQSGGAGAPSCFIVMEYS